MTDMWRYGGEAQLTADLVGSSVEARDGEIGKIDEASDEVGASSYLEPVGSSGGRDMKDHTFQYPQVSPVGTDAGRPPMQDRRGAKPDRGAPETNTSRRRSARAQLQGGARRPGRAAGPLDGPPDR